MKTIEIIFPSDFQSAEVLKRLRTDESGIAIDDAAPLASTMVDGFTIAGVILNAFSLATSLYALRSQVTPSKKDVSKPAKGIRIRRQFSSQVRVLPTGDIESIQKALEEITWSESHDQES